MTLGHLLPRLMLEIVIVVLISLGTWSVVGTAIYGVTAVTVFAMAIFAMLTARQAVRDAGIETDDDRQLAVATAIAVARSVAIAAIFPALPLIIWSGMRARRAAA